MFNSKHYVPIMKWKRAEQGALKTLANEHKQNITPVIQLVMPKPKGGEGMEQIISKFEKQTEQIPEKIIENWGTAPVFIDVSLLFTTPLKAESLSHIVAGGSKLGGVFIPVIHINDEPEIKTAAFAVANKTGVGLCLRLICSDLDDIKKLEQEIANLLLESSISPDKIDLLVDIKDTETNGDKFTKYSALSQKIPDLSKWRTFIFASGAFPKNLTECKIDNENLLPRTDWQNWKKHIGKNNLQRTPTFADYTIQTPIYEESTQFFPPSCSIKYTLEDSWLIMKGSKQQYQHYLANAATLVADSRFYGENFSDGDKYIFDKAAYFPTYAKNPALKGTGSTETWLKAGINHHLTLTAHQVASLA